METRSGETALPRVLTVLGRRGHVLHQAFRAVGLQSSYREGSPSFRRLGGVAGEIARQLGRGRAAYDLVLTDSPEYAPVSWIISKLLKKPLLIRVRGDIWAEINQKERCGAQGLPGVRWFVRVYEYLLKKSRAVIPVSRYLGDRICEKTGIAEERIVVIPISIDGAGFGRHAAGESPDDGFEDQALVLTVTNFRFPDKVSSLEVFFPSIIRFLELYPAAVFCVAGGGPYLEAFREKVGNLVRPLERRIRFLGFVQDLKPLYARARVFVYFSRLDALPRAVLEAQASGLPIIANAFGGIRELIHDGVTGLLVDSEDGFVRAAQTLFEDAPFRERLGRQAREFANKSYSPQAVGSQWIKALTWIRSGHDISA